MILEQHTIDVALNDIESQYNIVGTPIFLSLLSDNNWKTEFYNKLKELRKDAYQDNERIIVVQDTNDQYHYDDSSHSPGEMLVFLQQTLQEIDITNFFVLVVTPNPYVDKEIGTLQRDWSSDETRIQYYKLTGDYKKEKIKQDTFCVIPWMHFYLSTNGNVLPCCVSDRDFPVGNLKTEKLSEIYNGNKMAFIRKNMLNGIKSKECKNCYIKEHQGVESRREQYNKKWHKKIEKIKKITNKDGFLDELEIIEFHLGLNSVCNLMCRTCGGESSTKLAGEEKRLLHFSKNYDNILNVKQKSKIVNEISPYLQNADAISFAGGEPTRQKEQYEILDQLINMGLNSTVSLQYNINFTTIEFNGKSIIDYWNKFDNVRVNASIDGCGEQFEYIRHGANWKKVEKNFKKIKLQCPHVKLYVNSVVSFLSIESIIDLQRLWHDHNILSADNFEISLMLENAGYYEIQSLPQHHKIRISKKIDEHCDWLLDHNCLTLSSEWEKIRDYMNSADMTYILGETKKDTERRDKSRGVNFYTVFPHMADVFDLD